MDFLIEQFQSFRKLDTGTQWTIISAVATIPTILIGLLTLWYTRSQLHYAKKQHDDSLKQTTPQPVAKSDPALQVVPVTVEPPLTVLTDACYRTWLQHETGYIDIRGIGGTHGRGAAAIRPIPILDLYTDLYVEQGLTNLDLDRGDLKGKERIRLADVLKGTRCLAVMGDPGAGKTTFLRYIARKQLDDPTKPLPILLSLADVYRFFLASGESKERVLSPQTFVDYFVDQCKKKGLEFDRTLVGQKVVTGECLWLLDGVDELPSDEARHAIASAITDASRLWDLCHFVLTSRPLSLTGKAIPVGFEPVAIDRMHDDDMKRFLKAWIRVLFGDSSQSKQDDYFSDLYRSIDTPGLRTLARNPLMLTSVAVLHYNNKQLPQGRADLLEALVHWLVHERVRRLGRESGRAAFAEAIYRELALAMFEHPDGRQERVGLSWAAGKMAHHFNRNENDAIEFLGGEESESGILVRRGEGDIAFWHMWFQEYFAAKEIASRPDAGPENWWLKIKSRLDNPGWREMLALIPACLYRLGTPRVDRFFNKLSASCKKADLQTKVKRVGLGGRILQDLRMIGYDPVEVPAWSAILHEVTPLFMHEILGLTLRDRYDAAVACGLAGDERIAEFEKTWVAIDGDVFFMGAQSADSSGRNYDPLAKPWEGPVIKVQLEAFEIRRFPITVQEYREFISGLGYQKDEWWSADGWKWRSEKGVQSPSDWEDQLGMPNCPVTAVSWYEAEAYCNWLTTRANTAFVYSLPTEAQWEYVARRQLPPSARFSWGEILTNGDNAEANWVGSNLWKKSPVGMFPKSHTCDGITDLVGNVEEWCADVWSNDNSNYAADGSARVTPGEPLRVVRGGSTIRVFRLCRPTYRSKSTDRKRYHTIGFRPVRRKHS